ncbi:MAG: hypothetical protein H7124_05355 [Phycisphaerales bacterium]|nr:hypothetical protein [Hyphomonadaceae bacterium]
MNAISYRDVFEIEHDQSSSDELQAGDLVQTGPNLFPRFEVVAISGETVWVRNVNSGQDALLPTKRCRKVTAQGA